VSDGFVLDASVVLGWVLGERQVFERAKTVLLSLQSAKALVPVIWQAEVANALVVKERQKRIQETFLRKLLKQIGELPVVVDPLAGTEVFDRVLPLARRHQLSVYDACYLELAVREKVPLASFDSALMEAAKREGTSVLGTP
jgi:predicted nucleic acid-binding protein